MANKLCPLQNMKLPPKREVEPQYGATFQNLDTLLEKNVTVTEAEIEAYRNAAYAQLTEKNLSDLFADCRKEALRNIIIPLGLGHFVALYDKVGGNVDTVHNVRNDIWATDEERERYENRGEYDKNANHQGNPDYKRIKASYDKREGMGEVFTDPYSGKKIDKKNIDHVISAKEAHDDKGRVLAELDSSVLVNVDSNLTPTDETVNKVKKDMSISKFIESIPKKKEEYQKTIEKLKSKEPLNEKQQKELAAAERKLKKN